MKIKWFWTEDGRYIGPTKADVVWDILWLILFLGGLWISGRQIVKA